MPEPRNVCYIQSGGPTAVINQSALAVIETCIQYPQYFSTIFAGLQGISGALEEQLVPINPNDLELIHALKHSPSAAFLSCRHKLKDFKNNPTEYQRLLDVFAAHNIGYLFCNGGGDSQETIAKIATFCREQRFPLQCIGIPKTIDNDLYGTDNSPGFGSAAKYIATSIREASFDLKSMAGSSTQVFILEVMGRHAGWLAAASGLAATSEADAPHIILFPEIPFDEEAFLTQVRYCKQKHGFCTIVVSEGIRSKNNQLIQNNNYTDVFGHAQLGGIALFIAHLVQDKLGYKNHWAVADYLQRSARHIASQTDVNHAYAVGKAAVEYATQGHTAIMPTIIRTSNTPYCWEVNYTSLDQVAAKEKHLPRDFISSNGFHITDKAKQYLLPLIQGEAYPDYFNGLPHYTMLNLKGVKKKLEKMEAI
jgi:6-phosphofructokinase